MKKSTFFVAIMLLISAFAKAQVLEDYEHIKLNWFAAGENGYMHVVPNPDPVGNTSNYVVEFRRGADGDPWAGFWSRLPEPLDLTQHKYVYVDVWKPVISPVIFKLEPDGSPDVEVESMFPQTKVNEWETLVFDFSDQTGLFEVISFFPDYPETLEHTEDIMIYFDNIRVGGAPTEETEGFFLGWNIGSSAGTANFRTEYYSVWISNSGSDPADFEKIFEETLSADVPNWEYQPRQVNISEFAGDEIHVAFRHHESTDNDRVVLFDVKIFHLSDEEKSSETVLFFEDFNNGLGEDADWLPEGWAAVDADDDGHNWYFDEFEGDGYMLSRSWIGGEGGGALTPDNWLFTPAVTLGAVKNSKMGGYVVEDFDFIPMNIMLGDGEEEDTSNFRIVPNPDQSSGNPSNFVVRFHRSQHGVPWGGFWSPLPETVDMSVNKYVYVDVWKPRISPIKFKVEGGPGGTYELESIEPQTKEEEWETMVFHFPDADGEYPIVAFMPDFEDPLELTEDIVIYFDNIRVGAAPGDDDDPDTGVEYDFVWCDFEDELTNVGGFREPINANTTATDLPGEGAGGGTAIEVNYVLNNDALVTGYQMWSFPDRIDVSQYNFFAIRAKAATDIDNVGIVLRDDVDLNGRSYHSINLTTEWRNIYINLDDFTTQEGFDDPANLTLMHLIQVLFEDGKVSAADGVVHIDLVGFTQDEGMSVDEWATVGEAFSMYPNPARNQVHVSAGIGAVISLYDISGRMIAQRIASNELETINLSGLSEGLYIVRVMHNGRASTQKLMVY